MPKRMVPDLRPDLRPPKNATGSAPWPVAEVASRVGFTAEDEAVRAVSTWLDLLVEWNARHDLTAARSHDELCDLLLCDAAFFAARVPRGARVVDVGTGAGAPGLGLALMRPDLAVTLIEPLTKRVAFLRTVLGATKRLDVVLERARGEAHVPDPAAPARWDVAMARATLPPDAWLDLGAKLVSGTRDAGESGTVWLLLAQKDPPATTRARLVEDVRYVWPRTGQDRRALAYAIDPA